MNRICNKNRRVIYGRARYLTTISLAVLIFALTGPFSASLAGKKDPKVFSEEAGLDSLFSFLSEKKELAGSSDLTNELGRFFITDLNLGLGRFGFSAAISGDTVVIGAPRETVGANDSQGAAYVLVRSGTTWVFQQRLFAPDGTAGNQFARRVAIDGETIVVNSDASESGTGSAYVFVRNGTVWTQQQKLIASDATPLDRFGTSVDISGNTIIAGSTQDDINANDNQGSAYVFTRSGTVWSEQKKLIASDGAQFDQFGSSVSVSGDYAVVGDAADTVGGVAAQGSVYVFVRSGTDWTEQAKLIDSLGHDSDNFGTSVDLEGDTLAIGAFRGDVGTTAFNQGTVSVFVRHGASWSQQARLFSADGAQGDEFGISVSLSGNDLVVGADFNNVHGTSFPGAAYLFTRSGTAWTQRSKLIPSGNSDRFGQSVALGGNRIFVGAPVEDIGIQGKQGAAYFFLKPTAAPDLQAASDSGSSNSDNITKNRNLSFDVGGITKGATVNLLRDGTVVGSTVAVTDTITLTDAAAPANGVFKYAAQQIVNGETSSQSDDCTVTIDTTAPLPVVTRPVTQFPVVNSQPFNFTVNFNEIVSGVSLSSVSLSSSTANVSAANTFLSGSNASYNVTVNNVTSDGDVRVNILANSAQDVAGNNNAASVDTADNVVTYDTVRPTVTINQAAGQADPANTQPILFTVTFSEFVANFTADDISVTGSTAPVSLQNIDVIGALGSTYTISVHNLGSSNGGTIQLSVKPNAANDTAGNLSVASTSTDNVVIWDNTQPTVTINQAAGQADPTAVSPVNFRVVFSEPVTGFTSGDISLAASTANVSLANINVTGSGTTYDVAVSNIMSGGSVRATVPAGGTVDQAGNLSRVSTSTDNTVNFVFKRPQFDFDGDRKTDVSIFRPSVGVWWYVQSSNGADRLYQFGQATDMLTPGDYTGDGKADVAFWRPSTGEWFVQRSEDAQFFSFTFGATGDIPAPGDYDGDGKTDFAVFRPAISTWFISKSSGGIDIQQFGSDGDVPTVADYDGDGKTDIAIYRPALGQWWVQRSTAGLLAFQFGVSTDKPVPGDYTGDGKTDVAIFRPSTGEWFVLTSETFGVYAFPFGTSGDLPAPGDYDGDGKTDPAVFRPSAGTWFILGSTSGVTVAFWGSAEDKPVPASFIP